MNDEQLAEIEARAAAATAGPWETYAFDESQRPIIGLPYSGGKQELIAVVSVGSYRPRGFENLDFIIAARTDVPALVAEVRRLRAALALHHSQGEA